MSLASLIATGTKVWLDGVEHGGTRSRPEPRRTRHGWNRERQTNLAREPGVLERQRAAAATRNRLRQYRVKKPGDPPDKYVEAFASGDIQTNPMATNEAVEKSPKTYTYHIDQMPSPSIVSEIDRKVDMAALERELMEEGIKKFVEPQKALLRLIAQKRASRLARVTDHNLR